MEKAPYREVGIIRVWAGWEVFCWVVHVVGTEVGRVRQVVRILLWVSELDLNHCVL